MSAPLQRTRRPLLLITAVLTALPLAAGCRVFEEPTMSGTSYATTFVNPSSLDNARLDSCGPGTTSKVTVLNSGAQAAGYRVTVSYRDSIGHEVSVGVLDFTAVPGRSERTGRAPGPAVQASPVTCVLSDVVLAR